MQRAYTREQRIELEGRVRTGETPTCPACGGALARREVERPPQVSYVRRRALFICTICKRSAAIDVSGGAPP